MMRALWTAASGMTSQQLNVDTISNNISNVYTTGYKKEKLEFASLLYQTLERASEDAAVNGGIPINLQVGHGVRPLVSSRDFRTGNFERTENPLDLAIEGPGFFAVDMGDEELGIEQTGYTRVGSFKLSVGEDESTLVTSQGYPVLSTDGENITIPANISVHDINIDSAGRISYVEDNETVYLDTVINIVQFPNVQGLEAIGDTCFLQTAASGEPILESDGEVNKVSTIVQNYIETSNVNIAEEMVRLIIAQRAYDLNVKSVTTSDEMLQQANNLKK